MRKLTLLMLLFIPLSIFSQNTDQSLEKGIKMYNSLQAYIGGLDAENITSEVMNCVNEQVDNATVLLDEVSQSKHAEQVKVAQYFKLNFLYKRACLLAMRADTERCLQEMNALKDVFEMFGDTSNFPIRYSFEGKDFEIQYQDFSSTLPQFYTVMSELGCSLNEPVMQYEYALKAYNFSDAHAWYKYIAVTQMVDYLTNSHVLNMQTAQYALEQMTLFTYALTVEEQNLAIENNYPTPLSTASTLKMVLDNSSNPDEYAYVCGETAVILMESPETDEAQCLTFFEIAAKNGVKMKEALAFAKSRVSENPLSTTLETSQSALYERIRQMGVYVLDQFSADQIGLKCENFKASADEYALFEESFKTEYFLNRYNDCIEVHKKRKKPTNYLTKTR